MNNLGVRLFELLCIALMVVALPMVTTMAEGRQPDGVVATQGELLAHVASGPKGVGEPAVVRPLEGRVRVLREYPAEYQVVDHLTPGTMTHDWWTDQNVDAPLPLFVRREVTSPLDGTTALEQVVISNGGSTADHRMLRRIYRLGRELSPASRLAVFVKVDRLQPQQRNDSAGISVMLMRGGRGLTKFPYLLAAHGGVFFANPYFPNVVTLPDRFTGILDIPLDFTDEPFDAICLSMANYCAVGCNYTILDEVRLLAVPAQAGPSSSSLAVTLSAENHRVKSVSIKPAMVDVSLVGHGEKFVIEAVVDERTPVTFQLTGPDGIIDLGTVMAVRHGDLWLAAVTTTLSREQMTALRPATYRVTAITAHNATRSTTLMIRGET